MIHMLACNQRDCPWRRNKAFGCAHPDGAGKVVTRKSLEAAVPGNCPVRKHPDVLVAPPPAGGLFAPLAHVENVTSSVARDMQAWSELAHNVHCKRPH